MSDEGYYYRSEGVEEGPVSGDQLVELFATHMITAYDQARLTNGSDWLPVQQLVNEILEAKKSGARGKQGGADAGAREENALVAQRGAPTAKPEGSISDEEMARSIDYARTQVKRRQNLGTVVGFAVLAIGIGFGFRYSTNLRAGVAPMDVPLRVDTRLVMEGGNAKITAPRGGGEGTGSFVQTRIRDVTFASDGTVAMFFREESSRLRAELAGTAEHSEFRQGSLLGRAVSLTQTEAAWSATLVGAEARPRQLDRVKALAADNAALYPDKRIWPWPWQAWKVNEPDACSVLALDLEKCTGEVTLRFRGFVSCNSERCARLEFSGEWEGTSEGDAVNLTLKGEILRTLASAMDVSIQGEGGLILTRTTPGPVGTPPHIARISGPVVYSQTVGVAP